MENRITEMVVIPEGATYGVHITHIYNNVSCSPNLRTIFTEQQLHALEMEFEQSKYIGNERKKQLAEILGIEEKKVKYWFQNRRTRARRDGEIVEPSNANSPQHSTFSDQQDSDATIFNPHLNTEDDTSSETMGVWENKILRNNDQPNSLNIDEETVIYDPCGETMEVLHEMAQDDLEIKKQGIRILDHLIYDPITGIWRREM